MAMMSVKKHEYERIATKIADDIRQKSSRGTYRLPSEREIAEQFDCSRVTVRAALDRLASTGLVMRFPGKGTYTTDILLDPTGETKTRSRLTHIGLLIFNRSCSGAYADLMDGLRGALPETDCVVSIWQPRSGTNIPELMTAAVEEFDGLVIAGDFSQEDLAWGIKQRKPIVVIGLAGDDLLSAVGAKSVQLFHDERAAYMRAVEYLWSLGYRKPALLMGSHHRAYRARQEGFEDALRRAGEDPSKFLAVTATPEDVHIRPTHEQVLAAAEQIIAQPDRFDSVISSSFFEVMQAARARGLEPGKDFGLVGETAGEDRLAELYGITELRSDHTRLGKLAAEKLMMEFESKRRLHMRIPVSCELIIRESCPSRTVTKE
ncbi:MAG: GntR family transcriptional regulator [Phycisphaerae bacterium]|nr:GntR family transcriptional regulator [Phycisphaerae bacterium]